VAYTAAEMLSGCCCRKCATTSESDCHDLEAAASHTKRAKRVANLLLGGGVIGLGEVEQSTVPLATTLRYAVLRSAQSLVFCCASAYSLCANLAMCLTCKTHDDEKPEGATKYIVVEFNAWVYSGSDLLWASLVKELYDKVEGQLTKEAVREHRASIALSDELPTDSPETKRQKRRCSVRQRRVDASLSTACGLVTAVGLYFAFEQLLRVFLCPAASDAINAAAEFCNCTSGDLDASEAAGGCLPRCWLMPLWIFSDCCRLGFPHSRRACAFSTYTSSACGPTCAARRATCSSRRRRSRQGAPT